MKKRPIVCLVCIYIVFLIWVLVWQPEMGARLFRWEEKETRLVDQYNGGKVEGLLLQVEERNEGGRARLRLNDGTECILILSEDDVKIMDYDLKHFYTYGLYVFIETEHRDYKCNLRKFDQYFKGGKIVKTFDELFEKNGANYVSLGSNEGMA